jgi:myosin heavy chain 9/10/11/14
MSRLREENHSIRSEIDDLQLRYDDELYSSDNWKKEKVRLEARIATLSEAYDTATSKQADAQSQVVSLLSQVRELRAVLDEANAERSALARARKALELRMKDIAQEHLDSSQMSSDRVVQALHVERQDLRSALEEQTNRAQIANEKLKKAEVYASESQAELNRIREENAELDRKNVSN